MAGNLHIVKNYVKYIRKMCLYLKEMEESGEF